jgi:hypothetical protein
MLWTFSMPISGREMTVAGGDAASAPKSIPKSSYISLHAGTDSVLHNPTAEDVELLMLQGMRALCLAHFCN